MDSSGPANKVQKPVRPQKRNRLAVSCNHCRIRKLKCSRTQPCDACLRTGDRETCTYSPRPPRQNEENSLDQNTKEILGARISKLESLLLTVMSTNKSLQSSPVAPTAHETSRLDTSRASLKSQENEDLDNVISAFGSLNVDDVENQTIYLGGAHWVCLLSEVEELKSHLADSHELEKTALINHAGEKDTQDSASLLRGITPQTTREEILSCIPSRTITDILINRFFESYGTIFAFIHEHAFKKEYADHWANPAKSKVIWLGLLFAIMHCADISYEEAGQIDLWDQYNIPRRTDFKALIIQCLIASDYTNPTAYTIETLMLYIQFDGFTVPNLSIETPLILATTIRLAMRMGIHRSSSAYPNLSPFQGEMRRRLWASIVIADTMHSFQLSLPASIHKHECDCELPRNLRNEDFGPDSIELPPERPLSEFTECTYAILKTKFLLLFRDVICVANYSKNLEAELQNWELILSEAYEGIPPSLRAESVTKNLLTVSRMMLHHSIAFDRVYQLNRCMLYRRFLRRARKDTSVMRYRASCIDAALKLLGHQETLFIHFNAMFSPVVKRRHKFSHPMLDFFIAGMIVALDLYYGLETESAPSDEEQQTFGRLPDRLEMFTALQTSNRYWELSKENNIESAKAYGIFSYVLRKVEIHQGTRNEICDITLGPYGLPSAIENSHHNLELQLDAPEFDWESWNAYYGNDMDFDAFLHSSSATDQI